jgi:hypothetical protein
MSRCLSTTTAAGCCTPTAGCCACRRRTTRDSGVRRKNCALKGTAAFRTARGRVTCKHSRTSQIRNYSHAAGARSCEHYRISQTRNYSHVGGGGSCEHYLRFRCAECRCRRPPIPSVRRFSRLQTFWDPAASGLFGSRWIRIVPATRPPETDRDRVYATPSIPAKVSTARSVARELRVRQEAASGAGLRALAGLAALAGSAFLTGSAAAAGSAGAAASA